MNHDAIRQHSTDLDQLIGDYDLQVAENATLRTALAECEAQAPDYPSGIPMPTTDLPSWRWIWGDDFTDWEAAVGSIAPTGGGQITPALPGRWGFYPNTYKDTSKRGTYTPEKTVSVSNGVMRVRIHTDSTLTPRVCAPVPMIFGPDKNTWPDVNKTWPDQTYGRYAVRCRFPRPIPGYKVAWLLWPETGTNTTGHPNGGGWGEIDFPETNLDVLDKVGGFVHYLNATVGSDQYAMPVKSVDMRQWHTYVIEWSPGIVRFLLDDVTIGGTTNRVPNGPMRWVLQTECRLDLTANPGAAVIGDVEIDWAAVWAYAP